MSIYLYLKELNNLTKGYFKLPPFPDIVVYKKDNLEPLIASNDEDLINKLENISNDKNICINHNFWNYKINNYNQLSLKFTEEMEDKIKVLINDVKSGGYGLFLTHIVFHDILVNIYKLNEEKFKNMLNEINIDRNIISKLMIEYNYNLPITYNYYLLIKRIFYDYRILDLIFHKDNNECYFTCQQIIDILENIKFGDINLAYYTITKHKNYSLENKLRYIKCLLDVYNDRIDQEDIIYYSVKKPKFSLIFYLLNLDLEGPIVNLYYEVLNLALAKGSARKIIVIDDYELNLKLKNKIL